MESHASLSQAQPSEPGQQVRCCHDQHLLGPQRMTDIRGLDGEDRQAGVSCESQQPVAGAAGIDGADGAFPHALTQICGISKKKCLYLPQGTKTYEIKMLRSKRMTTALLFLQICGIACVTEMRFAKFAEVGGGTAPKIRALGLLQLGRGPGQATRSRHTRFPDAGYYVV